MFFGNLANIYGDEAMLKLVEMESLLGLPPVSHIIGLHCPFGLKSFKPTSWIYARCDISDMPTKRLHLKRLWYSRTDGSVVVARHQPTSGTTEYSLTHTMPSTPNIVILMVLYPVSLLHILIDLAGKCCLNLSQELKTASCLLLHLFSHQQQSLTKRCSGGRISEKWNQEKPAGDRTALVFWNFVARHILLVSLHLLRSLV